MENLRGHLEMVLLAVLAEGPGHGYAVLSALRDRTDGVLALTEGAAYPALHRLEDRGLLESDWQPVAGRRRRVYRVTAAGRAALRAERTDWRRLAGAIEAVLVNVTPQGVRT